MPPKLKPTAQAILIEPPDLPYAPWPPKDRWKKMNVSRGGWDWGSAAVSHGIFEAATEIYGERKPEKEVKAFGTFFNPYRTLMYEIAHRPGYKDTWNKRRRARGMPGKK
jgi:hypothetical protein